MVFTRNSRLLRHLRGKKAVACRDEAALPVPLPGQSFSEITTIAPGRGLDKIEAEDIEEVYYLGASHLPQAGTTIGVPQKHGEHQTIPHDGSVHKDRSSLRRLEFSDLTNIQWFSQDSFVDWDFIGDRVALDASDPTLWPSAWTPYPYHSAYLRSKIIQWRCIYSGAMMLTRKCLTDDRGSVSSLTRWLTLLVFISRHIREEQDCRTHASELRRRCELVDTSGRAMGFSYASMWDKIARLVQREDALDESL